MTIFNRLSDFCVVEPKEFVFHLGPNDCLTAKGESLLLSWMVC